MDPSNRPMDVTVSAEEPSDLRQNPWRDVGPSDLGVAASVPTMLTAEECQFYFWLARHQTSGTGAIVDLGCFAGGSTAHLAEGSRASGHRQTIHAFDRFRASEGVKKDVLYASGVGHFDGMNILPLAQDLLAPWSDTVVLHAGAIEEQHWGGDPIDLLIIDAAKSVALADHIAAQFFPCLIPGQSIVVQQDFLHWKTPWLPAQMELMQACFEPLSYCPPDTMAFRCSAPVTAEVLETGRVKSRRDGELIDALGASARRLAHWQIAPRLATSIAALRQNPHKRRAKDFTRRP